MGARVHGDGVLDIRGGQIEAPTAVTGSRAVLTGVAVNLVEAGSGGDPPVGFEATCAGPASASTGTSSGSPYWDSPLIDRGDPADPEPWRQGLINVIHGRRDIGRYEYGFRPPSAQIGVTPDLRVPPGQLVRLTTGAVDNDPGDPVSVRWTLSDGRSSTDREVFIEYGRVGRYEERLTTTDGVGLSTQGSVTITVARQRVMGLTIDPRAFRPNRRRAGKNRPAATIGYALAVRGAVNFHVDRAVPARAGRPRSWVRLGGRFRRRFGQAGHSALTWRGWIGGRRLRPGPHRLVARASSGPPRRVRFRVIR